MNPFGMDRNQVGKKKFFLRRTWLAIAQSIETPQEPFVELVLMMGWLYVHSNINNRQNIMETVSEGFTLYKRPPNGRYYARYSRAAAGVFGHLRPR
jgi:hypothetical protein